MSFELQEVVQLGEYVYLYHTYLSFTGICPSDTAWARSGFFKTLSDEDRRILYITTQNSALTSSIQNKLAVNTNDSRSTV